MRAPDWRWMSGVAWRDTDFSSYCWIHILLLKTWTSMPHYGNSWPPVCSLQSVLSRKHLSEPVITELPSWALAPSDLITSPSSLSCSSALRFPPSLLLLFSSSVYLLQMLPLALCGPRSTKRIPVWTPVLKLTQAIENTACVASDSWFRSHSGMKQSEESERWMRAWRPLRINKYFILVTLTSPAIPAENWTQMWRDYVIFSELYVMLK